MTIISIHLGIGAVDLIGHIGFYPNGGAYQYGCPVVSVDNYIEASNSEANNDVVTNVIQSHTVYCSHARVLDLFSDSLLQSDCQSVGYQCANYNNFKQVYISQLGFK